MRRFASSHSVPLLMAAAMMVLMPQAHANHDVVPPPDSAGSQADARDVSLVEGKLRVPLSPSTRRGDDVSVIHGVRVPDPYRWLENADDPEVDKWIVAQNRYAEAVLGAVPQGEALAARVRELAITSTTRSSPRLAGGTLFYMEETPPQPQPVLMAQKWPDGKARVLVDLNADGGGTAITGYWPSPSGRYLVYGTAEGGSELTTLHVLDVKAGKLMRDALPWAGGGTTPSDVAWDASERGFVYVRFPPPAKGKSVQQFDAALAYHLIGQPASTDKVVFGAEYSRIAEYRLLESSGARRLALLANAGDGGPADVYLRDGTRWRKLLGADADVRGAAWIGRRLVVQSFADAPRGKLLALGADGKFAPLLEQREGAIQNVAPVADGFLVVYSAGPDWWVEQFDAKATFVRRLALPDSGISIGGIASEAGQGKALVTWSGWTIPSRWSEFDATDGKLATRFEVKPAADYSGVEAHRIEGVSKDGTRIPVTVLAMKGTTPDGRRPTILYGYGGFDLPTAPRFVGANLAWLEKGGVYAYANIRGGNEFGQAWHRAGQKLDKQNVFDDFHAAAAALKTNGWTDRNHLGIMGGSNGGLLMGAQIVQHPGDYGAVVAMVGIYDMPRHETEFANGAYNVPEYGSIEDEAQFKATLAYSPLHHVTPKTAYPAVLMTTGANDSRVAPWQSRKFAAALQQASNSGQPILLLTRMDAGHGIGAPFAQRVGNTAVALSFFAWELGLPSGAAEVTR